MDDRIIKNKSKNNQGYLLIEAMIGISLLTIGFLGILSLVNQSASLSRVIGDQFVANYLATEGIEVTRNILEANYKSGSAWNSGFSSGNYEINYDSSLLEADQNRYFYLDEQTGRYNYSATGIQTPFQRTISVELLNSYEIRINSIVKWKSRGGADFEVNLEDHFFDWK